MRREFPEAPLVGVGAVIFAGERALIIRRGTAPMAGRWSIPGGLVELGETLAEAVVREAREETGLAVEVLQMVELVERIYRQDGREDGPVQYHYVVADYLCGVVDGQAAAGSDAADVRWIERREWLEENPHELEDMARRVLEAAWKQWKELRG